MSKVITYFNNVEYPFPGRRLSGIVSVPVRGKLFCLHRYRKTGFHEETIEDRIRVSIRHYQCRKCGRIAYVYGPIDDNAIEWSIASHGINR